MLAAVVFVLVNNLSKNQGSGAPNASYAIRPDNTNNDIIIQALTGETLKSGDFKISIIPVAGVPSTGTNPVYITCSGDFVAGAEIRADDDTSNVAETQGAPGTTGPGANAAPPLCNATTGVIQDADTPANALPGTGAPAPGLGTAAGCQNAAAAAPCLMNGDYRVILFHIPSASILKEQVITIS